MAVSSASHVQNLNLGTIMEHHEGQTLMTFDTCAQDGREPPPPRHSQAVDYSLHDAF